MIRKILTKSSAIMIGLFVGCAHATDTTQGAQIWANNCARCHNYRSPTEFSASQWQVIMHHMRIQGGLTDQEAKEVLAFLTSHSSNTQVSATTNSQTDTHEQTINTNKHQAHKPKTGTKSGSAVYQQSCAACHGANGKGAIPGVPDFAGKNSPLKSSDAILLQRIENGYQSPGSTMAMPPRGGNPKLTNVDLKSALKYIRDKFGGS